MDAHEIPSSNAGHSGNGGPLYPAAALIDGIPAEHLPADRGYDTDLVLAARRGMMRHCTQARHLVQNGFGKLKERSGDTLCAECGFVPSDMPDTHPSAVD